MTDFPGSVATIIVHTPIWVWPLYALLLYLGFQRTRDSIVPLWRVLILPLVVAFLAMLSIIGAGPGALPVVLVGVAIGSSVGWHLERDGATRRLPGGALWLRGEWWSFAQLVVVLVFRYGTSVVAGMDPSRNADPAWHLTTLFISTVLSALFLGRAAAKLRVYFAPVASPSHPIQTSNTQPGGTL